jgi:hypothetical protein
MKKLSLFILASLFIFGGTQQLYAGQQEHNHEHSENSEGKAINGLSLNHGKRWEMDKHTRIISVKMNDTFFNSDHSTKANLKSLGIKLETQLNDLIAGCTMEGEAHNQLHLFLTNYAPTIQNLAEAKNLDMARRSAIKLKGYLEAYKKHFK